jgi:hypothetical protein
MWRTAATQSRVQGFAGQSLAEHHTLYLCLGLMASAQSGRCAYRGAEVDEFAPEKWKRDIGCGDSFL